MEDTMLGGALPEIPKALSHDDLASDLAEYLRGSGNRVTWEDCQLGPAGSPRPDVYAMEKTYTRLSFEVFEVKVSAADFRSDVTSGKWQAYRPFANSVTFAAPAGMVTKADVPSACGLILRHAHGWRYAKRPVRQVLDEMPWRAWVKLLLDGTERATFARRVEHFNQYLAGRKLAHRFGEDVASMLSDLQELPARHKALRAHYERTSKELEERYRRLGNELRQQQEAGRLRCAGVLSRLAVALGMPCDAPVDELEAAAQRVLEILTAGARFTGRRNPFHSLAAELDGMANRIREVESFLKQVGGAPASEGEL